MEVNRFRMLAKGRKAQRGVMNRTEARFAERLQARKLGGDLQAYEFESVQFRIAHAGSSKGAMPAWYTPDFMVIENDCTVTFIEVKGAGKDDNASIVRLKSVAERYPYFRFLLVKERRKRDGGGFTEMEM